MTDWKRRLERNPRSRFQESEQWYDLIEDYGLIVSSFQSQYGIRLTRELSGMSWDEFCDLLAGLDHNTALGRIVSIRSEKDREMLKHFTPEQHRIRNEWLARQAKEVSQESLESALDFWKDGFIRMAGGDGYGR